MRLSDMKNKQRIKVISTILLIIAFVFSITIGIIDRSTALPENPMSDELIDSSKVMLSGEWKDLLEEDQEEDTEEEKEEEEQEDEVEENEEENEEDKEDEEDQEENEEDEQDKDVNETEKEQDNTEQAGKESSNQQTTKQEEGQEKSEDSDTYRDADGGEVDENSPNIDITEGSKDDGKVNEYFTTTITDKEVVSKEDYTFRIIQKEHDLIVKKTEVFLNGKEVEKFNGTVQLEKEENIIGVKITYENSKKEEFTVTKSYTVFYVEDEIIIQTNLEDGRTVEHEAFSFKANAMMNDENIPLQIKQNGQNIDASDKNEYNVTLQEGENTFVLQAEANGQQKEVSYVITYQKKEANIVIETDLKDEEVSNPEYGFHAVAKADDEIIDLQVNHNSEKINDDGNGNFNVTLVEGENIFTLEATHDGKTVTEQYKVIYAMPDGGKEDEETEQTIKLRISDLDDGQTLKNTVHTFNVEAIDEDGSRLTGRGVSISAQNNGETIPINWSNDAHNSFTFNVHDGTNNITVTAKDQDGNIGTRNLTVHGEIAGEGEPIGHITLSLEASTIGLGYIIPPTQVELYANERGSNTIDRIFKEHGISYDYTGSHADGFYLSYLTKLGLYHTAPSIPEDLLERLGDGVDINRYNENELGEFDFIATSGWMYSVNGTYPNVGFADYYFKDGDTVRIRFTLALGSDIGGGKPGSNFGKEW